MNELAEKEPKKLRALLADKMTALQEFRFNISGSKLKDVRLGRTLRREIARIHTVLQSKISKL
ncbi:MAG: 50S ribosomal protein L29 [Candidatus Taylorbacteria bacterium RIFCSPLOWO2_01_FULL_45_15b]|uniref:Large ribosomal subunit protein uL29 n=1 Tax=Candidatus Taylorbacteria bacterium RIFCSPLOWO2_01_FULL_45_15b TaxID=1802319 RepID=A0A1G2N7Y9_9BACT|nr:MAG: 50S ribosomal protein L29 [Candidatus Taylorbacteria bacterium RIFCSPLOWO2_01_FULL_45_15b]